MKDKKYIWLIVFSALGTIVAWQDIINQYITFYSYEGTILKISDCVIPNPVTTPCFYGGFGFILALILAIKFYLKAPTRKSLVWYTIYLLAGSIFAWSFAGPELYDFYTTPAGTGVIGCSGVVITNPFTTACFMGASLFLLSFLISLIILLKKK